MARGGDAGRNADKRRQLHCWPQRRIRPQLAPAGRALEIRLRVGDMYPQCAGRAECRGTAAGTVTGDATSEIRCLGGRPSRFSFQMTLKSPTYTSAVPVSGYSKGKEVTHLPRCDYAALQGASRLLTFADMDCEGLPQYGAARVGLIPDGRLQSLEYARSAGGLLPAHQTARCDLIARLQAIEVYAAGPG